MELALLPWKIDIDEVNVDCLNIDTLWESFRKVDKPKTIKTQTENKHIFWTSSDR